MYIGFEFLAIILGLVVYVLAGFIVSPLMKAFAIIIEEPPKGERFIKPSMIKRTWAFYLAIGLWPITMCFYSYFLLVWMRKLESKDE